MHFLMEWGLTPEQEAGAARQAEGEVRRRRADGRRADGARGRGGSFQIISATLSRQDDDAVARHVRQGAARTGRTGRRPRRGCRPRARSCWRRPSRRRGRSPTSRSRSTTAYQTLTPAARGRVTIDWIEARERAQDADAPSTRGSRPARRQTEDCFLVVCASSGSPNYSYSLQRGCGSSSTSSTRRRSSKSSSTRRWPTSAWRRSARRSSSSS